MHLVATVSRRVAGMVDKGGRHHLLEAFELPLVPDSDDVTPHHRFVFLPHPREASLHGMQPHPQEAPFQPQPDKPVPLSQRLTERALSSRFFSAELVTTIHGPV